MITLADFSEGSRSQGVGHLPRKSAKRRRIQLLEGSSSILQPLPCGPGEGSLMGTLDAMFHQGDAQRLRIQLPKGSSPVLCGPRRVGRASCDAQQAAI